MRIDNVRLKNFRSYKDAAFEFEPGVNIIVGPNASGKTNLLEALLVSCRGASFRARDADLPQFGAAWGRVDSSGKGGVRAVKLVHQDNGSIKKEFEIGGDKLARLSMPRTLPVVLFDPGHLHLLHGSPETRRDYIDDLLQNLIAEYAGLKRDYKRTLAQRNSLLKRMHQNGPGAKSQLFAWDVRLSETGALVAAERAKLVDKINKELGDLYDKLSGSSKTSVEIEYKPVCNINNYSSALLKTLEDRQGRDIERGFTTLGPHREDFTVTFDGRDAPEVASRGETRTVILALKTIELKMIEAAREQKPLLLLDDVFSELDGKRRKALTQTLKPYQTFITTTDADVVLHHFTEGCHIIPLG